MRSVVVVLPASMWAMMPIFLQRSSGTCRETDFFFSSLRDSCSFVTEPVKSLPFSISNSICVANCVATRQSLPPIMGEGFVSFGHAVHIFLFLDRRAAIVGRIQQFIAQLIDHPLLGTSSGVGN